VCSGAGKLERNHTERFQFLKGMVQQQNENHHPHIIPNMFEFLSTLEHKRRYFDKNVCVFVHTMEINGHQTFFKIYYFVPTAIKEKKKNQQRAV